MILSHEHKFIFLKTRKTAGTSLEIALSKYCQERDIITSVGDKDNAIRASLGYLGPQNYIRYRYYFSWKKLFRWHDRKSDLFYHHMKAKKVKKIVGKEVWDSYFKFAIVRNPFEFVVSRYFWSNAKGNTEKSRENFKKWLLSRHVDQLCGNKNIISIDDTSVLDFTIRFENFKEDLEKLADLIGLPNDLYETFKSIKAKSGIRPAHASVEYMFEGFSEGIQLIKEIFEDEILEYGYRVPNVV